MKKVLIWLLVLVTLAATGLTVGRRMSHVEYLADDAMRGRQFWAKRGSVAATLDKRSIPVQVPGPEQGWAGGGAGGIAVQSPYRGRVSLTLSLFDSPSQNPPLVQVVANGQEVGRMQVLAGKGTKYPAWFSQGQASDYQVIIPDGLLGDKHDLITLRPIKGSWMVVRQVRLARVVPLWLWAGALAGWLLLALLYAVYLTRGRLWGRHAINAALLVGSLLITLVAIELTLRWFFPQREYVPDTRVVYIHDDDLGYRLKPNVKTNLGFDTNRFGLRDYDRYSQDRPEGVYRILCVGDSFTFSLTRINEAYPKILERMLQGRKQKVEVLNCGTPAYGTDNEYYFLRLRGLKFQPKLVLVALFVGNDITDNYEHPSFTAVDGVMVRLKNLAALPPAQVTWEKRKRVLMNKSHLIRFVRNRRYADYLKGLQKTSQKVRDIMNSQLLAKGGRCTVMVGHQIHFDPATYEPATAQGWKNTIAYLDKLTALAKEKGFKLGIVVIPDAMQFVWSETKAMRQEAEAKGGNWDWEQPQKELNRLAIEHGWPMYDTLPEMRRRWDGTNIYYCGDTHFSEKGNKLFTKVVLDWLDKEGLVPGKKLKTTQ